MSIYKTAPAPVIEKEYRRPRRRGAMRTIGQVAGIGAELLRERVNYPRYESRPLTDPDEIIAARRLATDSFVKLGKIDPAKLGPDGLLLSDPLLSRSQFFGTFRDGQLDVTGRFVWDPKMHVRETRMPFEQLPPASVETLDALPSGSSAEIASLAKEPGTPTVATLMLIRQMVNFAYANGITHFTSGLEPRVYPLYKQYFGGAVQRLHPETVEFPGIAGRQVPILVDIGENLEEGLSNQRNGSEKSLGSRATEAAVRAFLASSRT